MDPTTNNLLQSTINPIVTETLESLRWRFTVEWIFATTKAMVMCSAALDGCSEDVQRKLVFQKQWNRWCNALGNQIETYHETIFDIGQANVESASPDPAGWSFDNLYQFVSERMNYLPNRHEHVVDGWIKPLLHRKRPDDPAPEWIDIYDVIHRNLATQGPTRDLIPELRFRFEERTINLLLALRADSYTRLATRGFEPHFNKQTGSSETATLERTLHDLAGAPRGPEVRRIVYEIYPRLCKEIVEARAAAHDERISLKQIRERFPNLASAKEADILDLVMDRPKNASPEAAAKQIMRNCSNLSPSTIDRYTRK